MPIAATSDEELLSLFVRGNRAALGTLAKRYETYLLGLACGLLDGRRDLACDAVQEAWVRVIRFAPKFDGESRVKTWLYRIVINQCQTLRIISRSSGRPQCHESAAIFEHHDPLTKAEESQQLRAAVEDLAQEQRATVLLCYHAGLTHPEAAEILDIPLGTLKSRLHAALTELRAALVREVLP